MAQTCWGSLAYAAVAAAAASGEGEGAFSASSSPSSATAEAMIGPAIMAQSPGRDVHNLGPNCELRAYREVRGDRVDCRVRGSERTTSPLVERMSVGIRVGFRVGGHKVSQRLMVL